MTPPSTPASDGRDLPDATQGRRPARSRMTAAERREQLIGTARGLFAQRGFDGTSVEEVAARAGVSKPVVYEHFGGKEGLYAVVVDREVRSLLTLMRGGADRRAPARAGGAGHPRAARLHRAVLGRVPDPGPGQPDRLGVPARSSRSSATSRRGWSTSWPRSSPPAASTPGPRRCTPRCWSGWSVRRASGGSTPRQPSKDVVAAHLVNLAWHGLAGLQPTPTLRSRNPVAGPRPRPRLGDMTFDVTADAYARFMGRFSAPWPSASSTSSPPGPGSARSTSAAGPARSPPRWSGCSGWTRWRRWTPRRPSWRSCASGCPGSTSARRPPRGCPSTTTGSTWPSRSSSCTSWPTRWPGCARWPG